MEKTGNLYSKWVIPRIMHCETFKAQHLEVLAFCNITGRTFDHFQHLRQKNSEKKFPKLRMNGIGFSFFLLQSSHAIKKHLE